MPQADTTPEPPPFRFPDKPSKEVGRAHLDVLERLDCYRCDLKIDGWRCLAYYDGNAISYLSCSGKPINVDEAVHAPFFRELRAELKATPAVIDCELTGNRRAGEAKDLFVLDVLRYGDHDLYGYGTDERRRVAEGLFPRRLVPSVTRGFLRFFAFHEQYTPLAEGVVLKHRKGPFVGSVDGNHKNAHWIKCKWRSGFDGTTRID